MNPSVLQVTESATIRIADMAREIERRGDSVIKLQTGDPDFSTPAVIIEAAHQAMRNGDTHYASSRGLTELRLVLAHKFMQDNGLDYNPDTELLVTHGASHGIFVALQTILTPGDEVLIPAPFWPSYASSVVICGGTPVQVDTDPQCAFRLNVDSLEKYINPRTKLLMLNSPCNPTGSVLSKDDLLAIARIVEKHDLLVIADEVYEKLIYNDVTHISFATLPDMKERTITINSLSKTYAMTGWRVGYLGADSKVVEQMLKVAQYAGTNVAPFSQRAAFVALTDSSMPSFVENMRSTYARRRDRVIEAVNKIKGLNLAIPQGAFYLMIDVSRFNVDSTVFSEELLKKKRLAVVPGVSFGDCAEGWIRITFAADEVTLMEGVKRLGEFAHSEYGLTNVVSPVIERSH